MAVEVLKASTRYPKAALEQLETPVEELTLAEASEESGNRCLNPAASDRPREAAGAEGRPRLDRPRP